MQDQNEVIGSVVCAWCGEPDVPLLDCTIGDLPHKGSSGLYFPIAVHEGCTSGNLVARTCRQGHRMLDGSPEDPGWREIPEGSGVWRLLCREQPCRAEAEFWYDEVSDLYDGFNTAPPAERLLELDQFFAVCEDKSLKLVTPVVDDVVGRQWMDYLLKGPGTWALEKARWEADHPGEAWPKPAQDLAALLRNPLFFKPLSEHSEDQIEILAAERALFFDLHGELLPETDVS